MNSVLKSSRTLFHFWNVPRSQEAYNGSDVATIREVLTTQCEAMAIYALDSGAKLPGGVMASLKDADPLFASHSNEPLSQANLEELISKHGLLSQLIAPAVPRTIALMQEDRLRHPFVSGFGSIPLVRKLLALGVFSLAAMILVSLSPDVNVENMRRDMLENSGLTLLLCEAFLLSAAAVGSAFGALFKLNGYVSRCTYDQRYDSSYWIQIVLGLISGVVLSQVIYHLLNGGRSDPLKTPAETFPLFEQPLLALLGGFSASVVYRIFSRLLTAAESVFGSK